MLKIASRIVAMAAVLIVLISTPALACSVFAASDSSQAYFCSNEDFDNGNTYVWFVPGGKGAYGVALLGYEDACVQGGMNEKGLALDWAGTEPQQMVYYPDRINPEGDKNRLYFGTLSETLLKKCATLDDVINLLNQYNESAFSYAHLMAADKTGASAIFEWHDKEFEVIKKSTSHQEMTNFNITAAATKAYPSTYDDAVHSYARYNAIKSVLDRAGSVSFDAARAALIAASDYKTQYSYICDLKRGVITLYDKLGFSKGRQIVLADELAKGTHINTTSMGAFSISQKYRLMGPINNQNPLAQGRGKAETMIACTASLVMAVLCAVFIRRKRIYILPAAAGLTVLPMALGLIHYGYFLRYGFTLGEKLLLALPVLFVLLSVAQAVCAVVLLIGKKRRNYIIFYIDTAISAAIAAALLSSVML